MKIVGLSQVQQNIKRIERQVPYALSRGINETLKDVQRDTVGSHLPSRFTLRSRGTPWQKPGNKLGFNIRWANKHTLRGILGSLAPWLHHQEQGGTRTAQSGKLAVPIEKNVRPSPTSVIPRRLRARALLDGRAFKMKLPDGNVGVFLREKKTKALKLLWIIQAAVTNKPRLGFGVHARAMINRTFRRHFDRELQKAIRSSK